MGGGISRLFSGLVWAKKEIRILILGLVCPQADPNAKPLWHTASNSYQDNAGKTTLLYRLKVQAPTACPIYVGMDANIKGLDRGGRYHDTYRGLQR